MSSAEEVILYDLPARDGHSWSLNPWKTRMLLNYKQIPYTTAWIEYPDIAPALSNFGIAPHADPSRADVPYTIPAIKLGDKYIMDSYAIAEAVERKYPTPSVKFDSPLLPVAREKLSAMLGPLRPVWLPGVPKNLLNPRSVEYFVRTRTEQLGMSLEEYPEKQGGVKAREAAAPKAKEFAEFVGGKVEESGGPFLEGKELTYADICIVTALHFLGRSDEKEFEHLMSTYPPLQSLYNAGKPWLERSDH